MARVLMIRWAWLSLFTVLYVLAGKASLAFASLHPSASPVWLPTGIALAAVLVLGRWMWPGIALGAFVTNVMTAGTVWTSLGIATGNTLEALVGAWLVERFAGGRRAFERTPTILRLAAAGAAGAAVSASLGVTSLALGGLAPWGQFGKVWLTWWLGNVVSAVIIAPLILLWTDVARERMDWRGAANGLALLAVSIVVALLVFGQWTPQAWIGQPLGYLCLLPLLWSAFQFGPRGTVTTAFAISMVAVEGTVRGMGPFQSRDPNESLLFLQAFIATITLTGLILSAAVRERARAYQALQASLREKEVLLKEIHHRVKNNLQIISSLLSLQAGHTVDPAVLALFRDSQSRIRSMALVHEKLYQSKDLSHIEMYDYVNSLVAQIVRAHRTDGSVAADVTADRVFMSIDAAVPCGLIINELVSNTFEHAFPDGGRGTVSVSLTGQPGGQLQLSVRDNGVGLPPGIDLKSTETLGFRLVQALVDQLDGTLEIERSGGGTGFVIRFAEPVKSTRP